MYDTTKETVLRVGVAVLNGWKFEFKRATKDSNHHTLWYSIPGETTIDLVKVDAKEQDWIEKLLDLINVPKIG